VSLLLNKANKRSFEGHPIAGWPFFFLQQISTLSIFSPVFFLPLNIILHFSLRITAMYHFKTFCTMMALCAIMSASAIHCHAQKNGSLANREQKSTKGKLYAGAKVGLVYILGLEMSYVLETQNTSRLYLAAALQSSFIINSANAGGGVFLGRSGVAVGCRYHHLLWFESENDSKIQPGYGPEVIYNKTIGTKYIVNLHAGGIITKGSFFPDISFGVFLPLN
jgi:hypothetical protein